MNNYQIAPSQLQVWSESEAPFGKWQRTIFKLPSNFSAEQACDNLKSLTEVLEILSTRLTKIESLNIPVQQVADPSEVDFSQIKTTVLNDSGNLQQVLNLFQSEISNGQAIVSLIINSEGEDLYAILLTHRSHFDSRSTQLLADMIIQPPHDYEGTQFLDFSEWLHEGFAEESSTQLSFWRDRYSVLSPDFGGAPTGESKTLKSSLKISFSNDINWEDTVLAAWLNALNTRLKLPEKLRFDRIISYRSMGELDMVLGPLQIRVPMCVNLSQNELYAQLSSERKLAEEHLTGFDLKATRESNAAIAFEVVESNVYSEPLSGRINLQACFDQGELQLSFNYFNDNISDEFAEIIIEATHLQLEDHLHIGPKELAWQEKFGNGGIHPQSKDPIEMLQLLVESKPNAGAVKWNGVTWNRTQLWERILAISETLKSNGIGSGNYIGFLLAKEHDAIATMFGILHAGATFVPLDPEWPTLRITTISEDAPLSMIITNRESLKNHAIKEVDLLLLNDLSVLKNNTSKKQLILGSSELGYVLYTSGSTGKPKGVCIPRIAISHLAHAFATSLYEGESVERTFTVNAPLIFDASIKQIAMLLLGGQLYLISEELRRQPSALTKTLLNDKVDCLDCTPTHLRLLLDACELEQINLPETVLIGGETIDDHLWKRLAEIRTTNFKNVYGPTEATVVSTWSPIESDLTPGIGQPLPGCKVWVRDELGQACPIGTIGELWIGGDRVAKGYLGLPDLTAHTFVDAPDGNGKAYRTGDQVRWLPDGRLAFHGRIDHQIKLRGHRIELGEIEAAFTAHPAVQNSAVIPHNSLSGEIHITAFAEVHSSSVTRDAILPNGKPLAERTRIETDYLFKEIFTDEVYAAHDVILPENGVIFDVGANIGMFSIWAKHRWPSASIHAFEPVPDVAKVCGQNLSDLNHVNLHPFGISNQPGELEFIHYPNYSMMSGIATGANSASEREVIQKQLENRVAQGDEVSAQLLNNLDQLLDGRFESEKIQISVRTLSEEFERLKVEEVHLLKIDVQRSELDVLKGLDDSSFSKVKQIVMEVHDAHGTPTQGRVDEIINLLEDYGFEVRVSQDDDLHGTDRFSMVAWRSEWRNVVSDSHQSQRICDLDDLHSWVSEHLPDYARPHQIKILKKIPVTTSGKIDRTSLLELTKTSQNQQQLDKPVNKIEERFVEIWSKILGLEDVSVTDSFFRLGGDSISGIRLQVECNAAGLYFELRHLFEHQTIRKLAACVIVTEEKQTKNLVPFALLKNPETRAKLPGNIDDAYPMSGLQLGMLFHTDQTGDPRTYHNITTKRIRADFSPEAFTLAWENCVQAHEILRTRFLFSSSEGPLQLVHTNVDVTPEYIDWSTLSMSEIDSRTNELLENELSMPFDFETPPLLRLRLCKLPDNQVLLAIAEHHAILDGLSLELLKKELLTRYKIALEGGIQPQLELNCRPSYFIEQEQSVLNCDLEPWRATLSNAQPIRIGYGQSLAIGSDRSFVRHTQKVDPTLKNALEERAQNLGVQLKHVLLAVHARVLGQRSGRGDVLTGLVLHGRPEHRDSEQMLGLFINTLPVRLQVDRGSWSELIHAAKDEDQRLQNYRHLPLWVLRREFGTSANLPTFFNYVAFESGESAFELLEERFVGVDVDVDLAVDFSIEDNELVILHQYPKATSDIVRSRELLDLTLQELEKASDTNDLPLEAIQAQKEPQIKVPEFSIDYKNGNRSASNTEIKRVISIVADVLALDKVSENDSFIELGGHSLQAVEVAHRLRLTGQNTSSLMRLLYSGSLSDVAASITPQNEEIISL